MQFIMTVHVKIFLTMISYNNPFSRILLLVHCAANINNYQLFQQSFLALSLCYYYEGCFYVGRPNKKNTQ